MKTHHAKKLATKLMDQYNLSDWEFKWLRSKRIFGKCRYVHKIIGLSKALTILNGEGVVKDTILHEIAHALTIGHGHDSIWRNKAIEIGCDGKRCYSLEEVVTPEDTYTYVCSKCGYEFKRYRKLRDYGSRWHKRCGSVEGRLKLKGGKR